MSRLDWGNYPNLNKVFKSLSDIKVINSVEYYRSVDALETVSYFGGDTRPSPIKYEAGVERLIGGFEVLIFDYQSSKNIFIKYPTLDHFIELYGGGIGSGRGDMKTGHASNIWEKEPWNYNIQFMRHGQNMFLMLGKNSIEFNFLDRIMNFQTKWRYPLQEMVEMNYVLNNFKYLSLPTEVVNVRHAYKLVDNPKFQIIITEQAFPQNYVKPNIYTIDSTKPGNVINLYTCRSHSVARDGGSTWITTDPIDGNINNFYRPTPFNTGEDTISTWNDNKLKPLTQKEKDQAIKLLNLIVEENPISYDSAPLGRKRNIKK